MPSMINVSRLQIAHRAFILAAVAASVLTGARAQSSWTAVSTPANDDLSAIDFPTDAVGYAVGDVGTAIKTTDGGNTWNTLTTDYVGKLWYVGFLNAERGIAVGDAGKAIITTNGGALWSPVNTGLERGKLPSFLFGL